MAVVALCAVATAVVLAIGGRHTPGLDADGAPSTSGTRASSTRSTTTTSTTTTAEPASTEPPRAVAPSTPVPATGVPATGELLVAGGGSAPVGSGPLTRYRVEVERATGIAAADFARAADAILAHPKGWTADGGVSLQRVADSSAAFRIVLATPATTDRLCAPLATNGYYSCRNGSNVVINVDRWNGGAAASGLGLADYRIYVISHEVGHALGHPHVGCPGAGMPAPVMMQQTKGIGSCAPNPYPFP